MSFAMLACSHQHKKPVQIQKNRERITQVDVKNTELSRKILRLENSLQQSLGEIDKLKKRIDELEKNKAVETSAVIEPIKEQKLPVIHENKKVTEKRQTMSRNILKRFETKLEKTKSNSSFVGKELDITRFVDANGEIVDFEKFRGKKVVLTILRGFYGEVCLVCSAQTAALIKSIEKFREKNTTVVAVYPGAVDTIPTFLESVQILHNESEVPFPVLLDADFSLVNTLKINGVLAKPSTLILDAKGIVRYAYVGKNPGDRPTIPTLLEELNRIN